MEPTHMYKHNERGRSFSADGRTGIKTARVTCKDCGNIGSMTVKALPPPELLDKKFVQKGWELDPNVCPECIIRNKQAKIAAKKERQEMNTMTKPAGTLSDNPVLKTVSTDTHKAQAKMHQLLTMHFDGDAGIYGEGWNDERIAKESGISVTYVTEVRGIAYGDLKEPEEIASLRADIKSLHELISETLIAAQKEVNALNNRVAEINKKLGLK
jgi:hypothetical protein